jgi:ribose transport system ATP-binding protein
LDSLVLDYTPTQRFQLALLRCVMQQPSVLILDEPTAALTSHDAEILMQLLRRWTRDGMAVLYVSHRLEEVLQISQRILVLRNGKKVGLLETAKQSHADLVSAMSGQTPSAEPHVVTGASPKTVLLDMQQVHTEDTALRGVDMRVHEGELLGVYGLAGAGRSEILETLMGLRAVQSGKMIWRTQSYQPSGPAFAARSGLALVPEDRRHNALVPGMRVRENLSLSFLHRLSRLGCLLRGRENSFAKHIRDSEVLVQGLGALYRGGHKRRRPTPRGVCRNTCPSSAGDAVQIPATSMTQPSSRVTKYGTLRFGSVLSHS